MSHPDPSITELRNRLDRVERRHRLERIGAGVAVALASVFLLTGQGSPGPARTLQAQKFLLVDAKGTTRGMWGVTGDGSPTIQLFDQHSQVRVALSILGDDEPALALTDENGKLRTFLKVTRDYSPTLQMFDQKGVARVGLSVLTNASEQEPTLVMMDKEGRVRSLYKLLGDGLPVMTMNDSLQQARFGLRLWENEMPQLLFRDDAARGRVQMTLLRDGSPRLVMSNPHGTVLYRAPK